MKKLFLYLFCFVSLAVQAGEYTIESLPNPKERNMQSYVCNPDNVLSKETEAILNQQLGALEQETKAQIAIVAVQSIGNEDITLFANQLFKKWGIGKEKTDNGLLLLLVVDQKKTRFETGYGMEGILPDAITTRIQTQLMIPEFRKGDYDAGILAAINKINTIIRKDPVPVVAEEPVHWNEVIPVALGIYLLLCALCFYWLHNVITAIRKNPAYETNIARYLAIKSQRTGIVSTFAVFAPIAGFIAILLFSNPLFLLLLIPVPVCALPSYFYGLLMMQKVRRQPIECNACGGSMHLLSEKEEDKYLKLGQQFEEQLHAVDYDVFICDKCQNEAIFTLDKPSEYSECPKCKTKAFILHEKHVVVSPTYISSGTERITYKCMFCGYEENDNHNLPRLTRAGGAIVGGAVGGSLFSGGGGFSSGGGFSGGSFGGGMSGGGGSTSGW